MLSVCLQLSGVSTILRELLQVRSIYGLCQPFFTVKSCKSRDFFHLSVLWLLPSATGYPGASWLALGFRHLVIFSACVPVSSCLSSVLVKWEKSTV